MIPNEKLVTLDPDHPDDSILEKAAKAMRGGGVIVCPTDTTYTLAANGLDPEAIRKVFSIKKRASGKPRHVVGGDMETASQVAFVNHTARTLAEKFLPGPLTIVLRKKENVPGVLVGGLNTIGIRIPDNRICSLLARKTGFPFTTTSANISGGTTTYSVDEIIEQFGVALERLNLILDQGPLPGLAPSTLVDLSETDIKILRHGPISEREILEALH